MPAVLLAVMAGACGKPLFRAPPEPPFPEPSGPGAIQELSLERGGCMVPSCPPYRYIFRRDGKATYDRMSPRDARLLERATAIMDSMTFEQLATAAHQRGFFRMDPSYHVATDRRQVTVRAVLPDTTKTVVEDEGMGPAALHQLQALLDSVGARLQWHVVRRSN
jgi:hypothetical protein